MLLIRPERDSSLAKELQELPERDGGVFRGSCRAALAPLVPDRRPVEEDLAHAAFQRPPNDRGAINAFSLCESVKASKSLLVQPDGCDRHANMMEYIVFIPVPEAERSDADERFTGPR